MCSPLLLVNKHKNSNSDKREFRLVLDLSWLNTNTKIILYPIPRIDQELRQFHGMNSINKLDVRHGFNHLELSKRAKRLSGFTIKGCIFRLVRLGFGYTNAPMYFQKTMHNLLFQQFD